MEPKKTNGKENDTKDIIEIKIKLKSIKWHLNRLKDELKTMEKYIIEVMGGGGK